MKNKAKLTITCLFQCLIYFLQFKSLYSETVLGEETGEFDFDGLPGVRYEFGFKVLPRTVECFYQTVREGAHLQVLYKILRGGGINVHVFLIDPSQKIIDSIANEPVGNFEMGVAETGDYSICIDNTRSQFTSKFVTIYLETYVTSDWEKFAEELDKIHVAVSNFTASIISVENSIKEVVQYQAHTKMNWAWDYHRAIRNKNYVQYWAILHCSLFIIMSVLHVYFVRRLFRYDNVTPTLKPRA